MRTVNILGSTGSIGQSTLKVIEAHPDQFQVGVLTAFSNVDRLIEQAIKFQPNLVVIGDPDKYETLKSGLAGTDITLAAGCDAVCDAAAQKSDITMAAIVGMAGLKPLMKAIEQGGVIAIANKEPLVSAGALVLAAADKHGATLLPVDSEHNAIFQVFEKDNAKSIDRIILTASGGPFREWNRRQIEKATPEQAVNHPNWSMGAKISVDSASMMNKALEVIEAHYLFDMPADKIDVLVHPQSLIHSMVEYSDGSILAQMGASDMCTPITNILGWPERMRTPGDRLNFKQINRLDFEDVNHELFPAVNMAYDALKEGQEACLVMNAANEVAVSAFLDRKIAFLDIHKVIIDVLEKREAASLNSLNDVISYDKVARDRAESLIL
ncbi:MAG: 1-deoxy-D-xylulose-5-phosphate reductoisomerase [Alphaproteobacteria bacterium]|nr:1-deoxy-D-xylulose-5-phosphate reductoisomerase [Alphaproteobacteria bacterium]